MYELISSEEFQVTRFVKLKNLYTGTIDECFDDSDVTDEGIDDFYFMKIGEKYNCKILLFGNVVKKKINDDCVICKIIDKNIIIGNSRFIKVKIAEDIYYISLDEALNCLDRDELIYDVGRKDLIQVDDVVNGRTLG